MGANGGTLPPDRKGKALSVGAHPADLAPRNPYHQGEGGHISIDDSARADECVFTNGHPADNRAVGPQGGPLFHQGVPVLFLAADRGARIVDIGENHAGPAKDIVFQRHIVIYGDIVLNLHIVADHHAVADKHILAQGALFPDHGASADVHPMPDTGSRTDARTRINDGRGMDTHASHNWPTFAELTGCANSGTIWLSPVCFRQSDA